MFSFTRDIMSAISFLYSLAYFSKASPMFSIMHSDLECQTKVVRKQHYFKRKTMNGKSEPLYFTKCTTKYTKEHSPLHKTISVTKLFKLPKLTPFPSKLPIKGILFAKQTLSCKSYLTTISLVIIFKPPPSNLVLLSASCICLCLTVCRGGTNLFMEQG